MTSGGDHARNAELALLAILTALMLWVIWPYAGAVFWAVVLAVILQPLWNWFDRRTPLPRSLRALLMILLVLMLIIIPVLSFVAMLPGQISALASELPTLRENFQTGIANLHEKLPPVLANQLDRIFPSAGSANQATLQLGGLINKLVSWLSSFALSAFSTFVMVTITLYVLYFFLVDGHKIVARIRSHLPFDSGLIDMLGVRFVEITKATVGGVFVIAIIQGVVCGSILAMLGVGSAVLLGFLTIILALIPAVGSGLVWVPVAIYLLSQGEIGRAITLLLAGIFVISMVDNLLRPRLVGQGARIPDFMILITTLGGIQLMGATGIILGPMIAGLCLSLWNARLPSIAAEQNPPADSGK